MYPICFVHIGKEFPEYLFESVYQALLMRNHVYILVNQCHVDMCRQKISAFTSYTVTKYKATIHSLESLPPTDLFQSFSVLFNTKFNNALEFRDAFWKSTIARFFYLYAFSLKLQQPFVHIENDVMIYDDTTSIIGSLSEIDDKMYVVKDSRKRVVPSIMFIPSNASLYLFLHFVMNTLTRSEQLINDMELLGMFQNVNYFHYGNYGNPESVYLYDGAAIGQFLGGIDPNNVTPAPLDLELFKYMRVGRGFLNETSEWSPTAYQYGMCMQQTQDLTIPIRRIVAVDKNVTIPLANLHVHSKQLYQFSSLFQYDFNNIITGDRVWRLCDYVIATREIVNYHKQIEKYVKNILLLPADEQEELHLPGLTSDSADGIIRIGIYTHIAPRVFSFLKDLKDSGKKYKVYFHNSDHSVDDVFVQQLGDCDHILTIYAQNLCVHHPKFTLLPIGIANSMFAHGDLKLLFRRMIQTYMYNKTNHLASSLGEHTHPSRKILLASMGIRQQASKPFEAYLEEVASSEFSLCIRGNGLDTHRMWESLYMGTIPVIVCNDTTNNKIFTEHLEKLGIPMHIIRDDICTSESLHNMDRHRNTNLYALPFLDVNFYR